MSEGTFAKTTTFKVVNGNRQYLFSSTRPEDMTGSGEKTRRGLRKLTDFLFQRIKLHLLVQKRNTDNHTEPLSHLPRIRKDENSPVHSRYRPAVLHLVNLVRQLNAPNRRELVHPYSHSTKQSTSPENSSTDPVALASHENQPSRQYQNGVPQTITVIEPLSEASSDSRMCHERPEGLAWITR